MKIARSVEIRSFLRTLSSLLIFGVSAYVLADEAASDEKVWPLIPGLGPLACGPLSEPLRHGPFDYRNPPREAIIGDVEAHHFNKRLAVMRRGKDWYFPAKEPALAKIHGDAGGSVASGFSYTLHAFPNHHRALRAMDELSRKKAFTERPTGAEYSVECFFERAVRFQPSDVVVRYLYADYLEARKRQADADVQLALISEEALASPQLAYNVGLLYAKRGSYDKAMEFAAVAYRAGFDLPGLKKILVRNGKWNLPEIKRTDNLPNGAGETAVVQGQKNSENTK